MNTKSSVDRPEPPPCSHGKEPPHPLGGRGQELYRLLFNAVNDAIVLVEAKTGAFVAVNDTFSRMTGFSPQEAKGLTIDVLFTGNSPYSGREARECIRRTLAAGPQLFEWQAVDRQGRLHWVELNLKPLRLGRKDYVLGTVRNIQARKELEQKVQQSEGAMMALLHALQDVALLLDRDGVILAANQTARKRLDPQGASCLGRNVFELLPPKVAEVRKAWAARVFRSGKVLSFEDENGGRHFLNTMYPIFDGQGEVIQLGVYAMDVSEARQAQRELAKIQGRLQCLLDHVPVALYGCSPTDCGRLTYVSKNIARLTGFTADEIQGDPFFWSQRLHPQDRHLCCQRQQEQWQSGHQSLEYRFRHQDGNYRWLHDEFTLVRDSDGQPLEYIGSLSDVTATRKAQEALTQSEARYRAIVECQSDLICRFTPDTKLLYVNEAVCRFLQKSRDELLGQHFGSLLTAVEPQSFRDWLAAFTPDQPVGDREYPVTLPDGGHRWLSWMVYAFFDGSERLQEFQAVGQDITARVAVEEALRQSEQRFRTYTENSLVGVLVLQDNRLRYVNPALAEMFGYEPAELLNDFDVMELLQPDHRELIKEKIRQSLAGAPPEQYTIQGRRRDGRVIHCELTSKRIDYEDRPAILATVVDITKRWEAETALRASEEKFRFLVEKMNDGLGICDAEQRIVYVNPRFCEIVGYSEAELLGRPLAELLDDENRQILKEQFGRRQAGIEQPYQLVWTRKDGSQVPTLVAPRSLFDQNGRFTGSFGIFTDISVYRQAEAALQRRQQYFRQLTDNVSDVIGLLTADGLINYLNPNVARLLGFDPPELLGSSGFDLIHPDDVASLTLRFQRLLRQAKENFGAIVRVRHRNGNWRLWQIRGKNLLTDPVVAGIVINARDITEQKKLEEALKQSTKKLRALTAQIFTAQETERRRLSLELHDELGQSLTALKLQLRAIANKLRKDQTHLREECSQMLAYINGVVENVRRLSHDLSPSLLENVGLGAALANLMENFRKFYHITDNLQTLEEIEALLPDDAKIHVYRIFQELFTNIEKHSQASAIEVKVQKTNHGLSFTIADNGLGFSVLEGDQKSSQDGLGLSAISERILMLGGTLDIDTQPQVGTRIHFTVPLQKKSPQKKKG